MNPNNVKQAQNLLWLRVPKNKRDSLRGEADVTEYIDQAHVVFIRLTHPHEGEVKPQQFSGEWEGSFRTPAFEPVNEQRVHIPVSYLKEIVDNITAEDVLLTVADEYPLMLSWTDKEDDWRALIAPRIENR